MSASPVCFNGMGRDNFTINFFYMLTHFNSTAWIELTCITEYEILQEYHNL